MDKELNIWVSEQAKEIFLCIAESPKTQKQIIEETGYAQPHVSVIVNKLENAGLIKKLDKKIHTSRKPQIIWDINSEPVFERLIAKKDPAIGEFVLKVDRFSKLIELVKPYLKTIAKYPLWRSQQWNENHKDAASIKITIIENEESYFKSLRKHKKIEPLIDGWSEYKKAKEKSIEFNLRTIGNNFTQYLVVNEADLNEKKIEFDKFLKWQHQPEFTVIRHYLKDESLKRI